MKILITGVSGFVASYLAEECLKNGDEVIGTFRWQEDLRRIEPFKDKITLEEVELTDLSSVIRCINKHRPDVISHLAAQSWVTSSMNNPIYTMKNNVESTLNIMEAVRIIQKVEIDTICKMFGYTTPTNSDYTKTYNPLIHICSSSEFYGKVDRKDLPITENHKANPGNVYGISKVAGDFLAQIYEKYYDLRILITRFFTHTGANRTMVSAENYYAKEVAMREVYNDNTIKIGDNEAMNSLRTWANVKDAVKNYRELFTNNKTGIYNISGETTKTIREVLNYLVSISNIKDKDKLIYIVDDQFTRKINVDAQIVSIDKYKQDNILHNDYSFEDTMKEILESWRNKLNGKNI